jgi:hypothetical protein
MGFELVVGFIGHFNNNSRLHFTNHYHAENDVPSHDLRHITLHSLDSELVRVTVGCELQCVHKVPSGF